MSLITKIKSDSLDARRLKNSLVANLLITLLAEAQAIGKNDGNRETTDAETVAIIKKFIKNLDETIRVSGPGLYSKNIMERDILETYLPKQFTEAEIQIIIDGLKTGEIMEPTMGNIQAYFKHMYAGQYDGAVVARLAR